MVIVEILERDNATQHNTNTLLAAADYKATKTSTAATSKLLSTEFLLGYWGPVQPVWMDGWMSGRDGNVFPE